ncbi:hypothetical protein V1281_006881 [Nitrobacteraceae bacterium AZCC 2161]|jgi:hypothetical protein
MPGLAPGIFRSHILVIPGHGRLSPDVNPESRDGFKLGDSHVEIPGSVPSPAGAGTAPE